MNQYRSKLRVAFYSLSYFFRIIPLFYFINRNKRRILVYHHIIPDEYWDDKLHLTVAIPESKFRKQLDIIKKHFDYSSVSLDQSPSLMITFDDGYQCSVLSSNILEEYGFRGVYFIPVTNVGSKQPLWIDEIMKWFSYVPYNMYQIGADVYHIFSEADRRDAYNHFSLKFYTEYNPTKFLTELNKAYLIEEIDKYITSKYNHVRFHGLSPDEIIEMQKRGHAIGAHSYRHDILSQLSDNELHHNFDESQNLIGSVYNSNIFAYPFGHSRDLNDNVIECCRNSKFKYAVINDNYESKDLYQLSRINISWYDNKYEIHAHLSGYVNTLKKWIRLIL